MKYQQISPYNFSHSYPRIWIKNILIFIGIGFLFFGIYRESQRANEEEKTLWLVDTSLSMAVQDIRGEGDILISRLDLAKSLILSGRTLIPGQHALMTFGDGARLILPFSDESDTFFSTVHSLSPTLYNSETDIESALSAVSLIYGEMPIRIILLSDGEETVVKKNEQKISKNQRNITLIGIGTPNGGPMLQGYDANGNPRYKQYEGKAAISRRDTANIDRLTTLYGAHSTLINTTQVYDSFVHSLTEDISIPYIFDIHLLLVFGAFLLLSGLMLPPVYYHS